MRKDKQYKKMIEQAMNTTIYDKFRNVIKAKESLGETLSIDGSFGVVYRLNTNDGTSQVIKLQNINDITLDIISRTVKYCIEEGKESDVLKEAIAAIEKKEEEKGQSLSEDEKNEVLESLQCYAENFSKVMEDVINEAKTQDSHKQECFVGCNGYSEIFEMYNDDINTPQKFVLIRMDEYSTLSRHLRKIKDDEVKILNLAMQLSWALEILEKDEIVHRDIKPNNVFVEIKNGKEIYKLGDFGAVRYSDRGTISRIDPYGDDNGSCIPPEVLNAEGEIFYTSKSDQYLLGLMLLRFKNPLLTTTVLNDCHKHGKEASFDKFDSIQLTNIVTKAVSIDPDQRYNKNSTFHNEFKKLKDNLNVKSVSIVTYKNSHCGDTWISTPVILELKDENWLTEDGKIKKFARNSTGKFEAKIQVALHNGLTFEKEVTFEKENSTEGLWQIAYVRENQYLNFYLSEKDARETKYAARVNLMDLRLNAREI